MAAGVSAVRQPLYRAARHAAVPAPSETVRPLFLQLERHALPEHVHDRAVLDASRVSEGYGLGVRDLRRGRWAARQHSRLGRHAAARRLGHVGARCLLRRETRGWGKAHISQRMRVFHDMRRDDLRRLARAVARPAARDRRLRGNVQTPQPHCHPVSGRARSVAQHPLGLYPDLDADNHAARRAHTRRRWNRLSRAPLRRRPARGARQLDRALRTAGCRLPDSARRLRRRAEPQPLRRLAAHVFSIRADMRLGGVRAAMAGGYSQAAPSIRRLRVGGARNRARRRPDCQPSPLSKRILQPVGGQERHSRPLANGLLGGILPGSARNDAENADGRARRRGCGLGPRQGGAKHGAHTEG